MVISSSFPPSHISSFPPSHIAQSGSYQTLYDQGYLLLGAGYYREALVCFDQAIAVTPDQADAWFRRGDALTYLGHHQEALFSFDQALLFQPDYQQAWAFRGAVLIQLERYPEAVDSCDRALNLDPTDSAAWIMRGVALHRLKCYRQAYASYDRALGIEREPSLFTPIIEPILACCKQVWTQLPFTRSHRYSTRQNHSFHQPQKRTSMGTSMDGWGISTAISFLLFAAIICIQLISLLH